jgi:hypothetical protein
MDGIWESVVGRENPLEFPINQSTLLVQIF